MTDNEKLIDSIRLVVDDYNSTIRSKNKDDFDMVDAVAIRRTLRMVGFKLLYDDDGTIRKVVLPDYSGIRNDF